MNHSKNKGFTLLELLIVIAIISILATILIFVLNPAETLQRSRDVQRISDLGALKSAMGVYLTTVSSPQLDGTSGTANDKCVGGGGTVTMYMSVAISDETITDTTEPSPFTVFLQSNTTTSSVPIDGTGWIPVNFGSIVGGSPISNMPIDPTNDVSITTGSDTSTAADVTNGALIYRYACRKSALGFEVNARLESSEFGVGGASDKAAADGGGNVLLYEVGTDLTILPTSNDF